MHSLQIDCGDALHCAKTVVHGIVSKTCDLSTPVSCGDNVNQCVSQPQATSGLDAQYCCCSTDLYNGAARVGAGVVALSLAALLARL